MDLRRELARYGDVEDRKLVSVEFADVAPVNVPVLVQTPPIFTCVYHVGWIPCHHGMARPQVADGGDTLHVRRVAANIMNKQSRTADNGWSSSLVGHGG
jgi:hypothetical protein